MKKTSISIIAIALATTIGAASFATTPFAAPGDNGRQQQTVERGEKSGEVRGSRDRAKRGGAQGGFLALVCSSKGSERLDNMLGNLPERIELTDAQKVLFDDFAIAATSAQATFAENCVPRANKDHSDNDNDSEAEETTENMRTFSPVERMKSRATNMDAASTALESVIPSAETFFDSLTQEQTAQLAQRRNR